MVVLREVPSYCVKGEDTYSDYVVELLCFTAGPFWSALACTVSAKFPGLLEGGERFRDSTQDCPFEMVLDLVRKCGDDRFSRLD